MTRYFELKETNGNVYFVREPFRTENDTHIGAGFFADFVRKFDDIWVEGLFPFYCLQSLTLLDHEPKYYYKVVNKKLHSARFGSVDYKIGEWVHAPKDTRLFVFNDLAQAKKFAMPSSDLIFKCIVKEPLNGFPASRYVDINEFWYNFNRTNSMSKVSTVIEVNLDMPSVLVKAVKLIEKC